MKRIGASRIISRSSVASAMEVLLTPFSILANELGVLFTTRYLGPLHWDSIYMEESYGVWVFWPLFFPGTAFLIVRGASRATLSELTQLLLLGSAVMGHGVGASVL